MTQSAHALPAVAPSERASAVPIVSIFGIPFGAVSREEASRCIGEMLAGDGRHQIVLANAHTLNLAYEDAAYRRVLQQATLVLRDGIGVELAARLQRARLADNFVGTDFVPELLAAVGDLRPRVFLYGAAPGVAAIAAHALEARAPGVQVVGTADGYGDAAAVVARIRSAQPDVLLAALGNPRQELWIAEWLPVLDVRVAIGVGALFDYLAGRVPRAPDWVRRMRGEWIFRLAVEPRRLWRRYLLGNVRFLCRAVRATGRRNGAAS